MNPVMALMMTTPRMTPVSIQCPSSAVTFATALPDADYCWTALARSSSNSGTQRLAIVRSTSDQKTAEYVDLSCATTAASFSDSAEINLVVFR